MKKENLVKFDELEIDILASEHELSHVRGGAAIHPIIPVVIAVLADVLSDDDGGTNNNCGCTNNCGC